jgi:dipeptidyl aminopeptidase/acylaminoacyl peptidase
MINIKSCRLPAIQNRRTALALTGLMAAALILPPAASKAAPAALIASPQADPAKLAAADEARAKLEAQVGAPVRAQVDAQAGPIRTPMSAEDLVTLPRLGGVSVSPNGRFALYRVTETNAEDFTRSAQYFLLDLEQPGAAAMTADLGPDVFAATFGGDGAVYFLSGRAHGEDQTERTRLYRAELTSTGGFAPGTMIADSSGAPIEGFALSPDAKKVALWSEISRDCEKFGCAGDGQGHLPGPGSGRLYDGDAGLVRHWDHWTSPGSLGRVFVFELGQGGGFDAALSDGVPLDGPKVEGPEAASPLSGHTPTRPFGGGEDIVWAPDSSGVYFTARQAGAGEAVSTNLDIWWSDLSGGAPTNLTRANAALDTAPSPSPDGRWLAYLAMARPGYESDQLVIHLRNLRNGQTRALTKGFDRSFGSLSWSADSRKIIATAQDLLDTPAFEVDRRSGEVRKLDLVAGNEAHLGNVTPLPGGKLLFTRDSIAHPAEIYITHNSVTNGRGHSLPLTDVARSRLGERAAITVTRFNFAGANGDTVWGQITKPDGYDAPLPAILYVHGGPQGSFSDRWSTRWNPRVLAARGFAVISVDFHGSTGYGQAFTDSINRDWGGKPLVDLQKGLAAALALDSDIDGSRACAMGASYGGYMMNWIAGKWPERFRCLVQHDGLFDMRSFYYSTEELWFPRWDFGGSYAEASEEYERWNPVHHVDQWQTPMLVIAGEQDFRVPYTQGIASFTALQERGIPSQLLVFPDENHWVLGAKNSLQWHNTVFAWLDRWLKPE